MSDELAGRRALVTGGAGHLGQAICRRLAAAGSAVAVGCSGTATADRAARLVAELAESGKTAVVVTGDVSDQASAGAMVDMAAVMMGGLDLLVNNAGVVDPGYARWLSPQRWREVLAVNLDGHFTAPRPRSRI